MKRTRAFFYLSLAILILMAACAPAATPIVIVVTATSQATEAPAVSEEMVAVPSPTVAPISLAGPPMQVGSTYLYFDGTTLVAVPGGPFSMGHGGSDNPVHQVTLGDFWIYSTKVTNQQYAACVKQGQCSGPDLNDNSGYDDPMRFNDPVVGVNWLQAQAYCSYAHGFLPTEAQWEKTARGPDANLYPWGNNAPACDLLNYSNCVGKTTYVTKYPQGQSYYKALDMEGNSYEWVADWYNALYYRNAPAQDPLGPEFGNIRSVRSSSYRSNNDQVPASTRFYANPTDHRRDLGFRCVVTDPTYFAPMCSLAAYVGPNLGGNPADLGISVYCPNLTASAGQLSCGSGVTIITFTDDQPTDPNITFDAPGCTPVSDEVSGGKRVVKYQCINQYGTATVSSKCIYKGAVNGTCPAHYTLDASTGTCNWDGSGTLGSNCPAGYTYDPVNLCCTASAGSGANFSACPAGSSIADLGGGVFMCYASGIYGKAQPASADMTPPGECPPPPGSGCDPSKDPNCSPPPYCPGGGYWNGKCCVNPTNGACASTYCLSVHTMIDTPNGPKAVEDLRVGDQVWSVDVGGERLAATVLRVAQTQVPADHQMVRIILTDGRELYASLGHPTADGRILGDLQPGDILDGGRVVSIERGPYNQPATYDLLPSGGTGFYWANGILIGSTLAGH